MMTRKEERSLGLYVIGGKITDMVAWDKMVETTNKTTKGKDRVFDPFVGYIEKEKEAK